MNDSGIPTSVWENSQIIDGDNEKYFCMNVI